MIARPYERLFETLRETGTLEAEQLSDRMWHPLLSQAHVAYQTFFFDSEWCKRRVIFLEFIEERRGQWSTSVDFVLPRDLEGLELLRTATSQKLRWPLATFNKDILPPAHLNTKDEEDVELSVATSRSSRELAFAFLCAAAAQTHVCPRCLASDLWAITSSNPLEAEFACRGVRDNFPKHKSCWHTDPVAGLRTSDDPLRDFVTVARLFRRSVPLTFELPWSVIGKRKIVSIGFDGPVRVTKRPLEWAGWSPLVVAPRAAFGGEARSHHLEVSPPTRVTVVDSRLLYSYFAPRTRRKTSDPRRNPELDPEPDRELAKQADVEKMSDLAGVLGASGYKQWWGTVEGPAEPMSAHVRCDAHRMPQLVEGRDAFGVFQLYPQFTGVLSEIFLAGAVNFGFVMAFLCGLHFGGLASFTTEHPEAVLIIAALIAGLGFGLAVYPAEHLLTSSVLRPWRRLVSVLVGLTIAAPLTAIWGWHETKGPVGHLRLHPAPLWTEFVLAITCMVWLATICIRPWKAETTGQPAFHLTGYRIRRRSFPLRRSLDDNEIVQRYADGKHRWIKARAGDREAKRRLVARLARRYLLEERRRQLFNRGIPPSVRHAHSQRGG